MEAIHDSGRIRLLGISNLSLEQVERLCQRARVRPRFVQNRCYAVLGKSEARNPKYETNPKSEIRKSKAFTTESQRRQRRLFCLCALCDSVVRVF